MKNWLIVIIIGVIIYLIMKNKSESRSKIDEKRIRAVTQYWNGKEWVWIEVP